MTCLIATKVRSSLITVTIIVKLMMVATASNADRRASAADTRDWGCVAAAAEYEHFGDVSGVPMSLVEGEILLQLPKLYLSCCCVCSF